MYVKEGKGKTAQDVCAWSRSPDNATETKYLSFYPSVCLYIDYFLAGVVAQKPSDTMVRGDDLAAGVTLPPCDGDLPIMSLTRSLLPSARKPDVEVKI